jgi:N-methylhydantoinase A
VTATLTWSGVTARRMARHALAEPAVGLGPAAVADGLEQAGAELGAPPARVRVRHELRYRGQSFELTVPLQPELAAAFHRAHEERYGYADESRDVELVAVRTADVVPAPAVSLQVTERHTVMGPQVLELAGATCWVPDGWHGETNDDGTLVLTR